MRIKQCYTYGENMKKQTLFILFLSLFTVGFSFVADAMQTPQQVGIFAAYTQLQMLSLDPNLNIHELWTLHNQAQILYQRALNQGHPITQRKIDKLANKIQSRISSYVPEGTNSSRLAPAVDDRAAEY